MKKLTCLLFLCFILIPALTFSKPKAVTFKIFNDGAGCPLVLSIVKGTSIIQKRIEIPRTHPKYIKEKGKAGETIQIQINEVCGIERVCLFLYIIVDGKIIKKIQTEGAYCELVYFYTFK